ncbi:hypothetical protein [Sporosarcina highlanderae]|uniref:Uncharacterized protein n=1 Tax=Sporosarcina highlanderae TaxID=3035916 RepID=A0ABT8JTM9_9BACL|nr:hypothetical protein [Sporosarcina highlanderae]MDN4608352.1 hypothetical protein [Sporosarcina highlanderae]
MSKSEHTTSEENRKNIDFRYLAHPEGIPSDRVSLFDMHEDMQTVDTINLDDMKEDLRKERIHKNPRG